MRKISLFLMIMLVFGTHLKGTDSYFNVLDFGAKSNGTSLTTKELQKTIDACARAGGGKVVFPAGTYLTAPLTLYSNMEIEIMAGATILLSDNIKNTPAIDGSWEGIERKVYASLFTGHDLDNIAITGRGKIDGQGKAWWDAFWETDKIRTAHNIREREPENPEGSPLKYPRPRMINLYNCNNVLISGITITNSPSWTVHPVYCTNITIRDISIIQPYESPNTDGINPESCKNVRIMNCFVDCGDDCITLKAGYNEHGRKKGIPCENIVISNCTFAHGRSAIGIGSEMSGSVRNVTISNCVFKGTLRGLRIKTGRGRGGVVENILADNIIMENIEEGISIDMYYEGASDEALPITEETPFFRNIRYTNIMGNNINKAINILGLPEAPIDGLVLENIKMDAKEGLNCKFANDLVLKNIELNITGNKPVFNINRSADVTIDNCKARKSKMDIPVIDIKNSESIIVQNCKARGGTEIFFRAGNSRQIEFLNNLLGNAKIIK